MILLKRRIKFIIHWNIRNSRIMTAIILLKILNEGPHEGFPLFSIFDKSYSFIKFFSQFLFLYLIILDTQVRFVILLLNYFKVLIPLFFYVRPPPPLQDPTESRKKNCMVQNKMTTFSCCQLFLLVLWSHVNWFNDKYERNCMYCTAIFRATYKIMV